ncbi:TPA: hypothetical protein DIV55_07255 [Patescibacteria group bacterium]|uniref:Uncharacterized protein n=1 Tax=Candidatus Gottesmanbacteria bacterium GW2011_GWA1_43_11 TaxID=1618436 RepID=A0A0G1CH31_9BACT|nr:MAG: hypothetical protein UV59_C0014G0022 [Candidatus Gottesmanbacteria bacterium GW2011_GWA1_43_11]HCS79499.1 hypothetical protein [Patescibacteria group bacterium]
MSNWKEDAERMATVHAQNAGLVNPDNPKVIKLHNEIFAQLKVAEVLQWILDQANSPDAGDASKAGFHNQLVTLNRGFDERFVLTRPENSAKLGIASEIGNTLLVVGIDTVRYMPLKAAIVYTQRVNPNNADLAIKINECSNEDGLGNFIMRSLLETPISHFNHTIRELTPALHEQYKGYFNSDKSTLLA